MKARLNLLFSTQLDGVLFTGVGYTGDAGGRTIAAAERRGRKVRTPQGSVPDNVRDGRLKTAGRLVPQRIYRPKLLNFQ